MNAAHSTPPAIRRLRSVWRWVLLACAICATPFLLLAVVAVSALQLDRDATALREEVMRVTDAGWNRKIQLSVGRVVLGATRAGLSFVKHEDVAEARQVLAAVRSASVGIYERPGSGEAWSRQKLFAEADRAMSKRDLVRLVGVSDETSTVLIYGPREMSRNETIKLCLAVLEKDELIVVSTRVDAGQLAKFVSEQTTRDGRNGFKLARLKF